MQCFAWSQISAPQHFLKGKKNYSLRKLHFLLTVMTEGCCSLLGLNCAVTSSPGVYYSIFASIITFFLTFRQDNLEHQWNFSSIFVKVSEFRSETEKLLLLSKCCHTPFDGQPQSWATKQSSNIFLKLPGTYKSRSWIYRKNLYIADM